MTPTTTSPISDQAAGEQDQEGFERFAAQQGYDVKRSGRNMSTSSGIFPATYYKDVTEHAWRGWANRRSTAPTTGSAPESEWITKLRRELMTSKMTHNFTFSRDEVIEMLGGQFALLAASTGGDRT